MIPARLKLNVPAIRQSFARDYGQPSRFGCHTRALEQANDILNRILARTKERPWLWSTHIGSGIAEISTDPDGEFLSTIKIPMDCIVKKLPL